MAAWVATAAAIVAHWITMLRDRQVIHPGFSLPLVAGPFIASISLQANDWHQLAQGISAIGTYSWMTFGLHRATGVENNMGRTVFD
ncbi:hypothetical protein JVX93_04175 [Mycolicibacterium boenickei]|nr:hypothetical protein JVX93_04175 [Mycolicibacterium boenickei]